MAAHDPNTNSPQEDGASLFVSRFDNKVDEKRRVQVPSVWRRGRMGGLRYLLMPVPKRLWRPACLVVMPPERFLRTVAELRTMKISDERADSLRRLLATRASEVETDSAGRICLPEEATTSVDVQDRVILAGMLDWFEIWKPERYEQVIAQDNEESPEAYQLV